MGLAMDGKHGNHELHENSSSYNKAYHLICKKVVMSETVIGHNLKVSSTFRSLLA